MTTETDPTPDAGGSSDELSLPAHSASEEEVVDGELVQQVVRAAMREVRQEVRREVRVYSGPIPSGEMMDGYNRAMPNGAERAMQMAETQASHRQEMERLTVQADIDLSFRGLNYAFILGIVALIGGLVLVATGHALVSLVPFLGGVATLVGLFIFRQRQDDSHEHGPELPAPQPLSPPLVPPEIDPAEPPSA